MVKNLFNLKILGLMLLGTGVFGQVVNRPNDGMVRQALMQSSTERSLLSGDLNYELTDFYASKKSGAQYIYFRQSFNGLEIIGTESAIHLTADGKVFSVSNKFTNSIEKRAGNVTANPQLTAVQAVSAAATHLGYNLTQALSVLSQEFTADRKSIVSNGGISLSNIPAKLKYYLQEDGTLALVWEVSIQSTNKTEWYNLWVNASNGKVLSKSNWISSCGFEHEHDGDEDNWHIHQEAAPEAQLVNAPEALPGSYNVFAMPLESPYYGGRTMVTADAAVNLVASPFGWHDTNGVAGAEYTKTRGNNVNAYEDGNNPGFQPDGGSTLVFDFPFDQNYSSANQYESAAITNLFYWNNIIHDVFYQYGFDAAGGNFQQNNYGGGGAGNDYVFAEAQDGSGTCNANFGTPPDGQNPTMQMYVCGNKDGDFDNLVIMHEYGHGISNRLTGGPANSDCLYNDEQMGEGWSDFFGLMLTMDANDQGTDGRGIGTYLFGEGAGGDGIRTYRYSTDLSINPHTYNDIKTEAVPHGVGSVWAAMLWEMTWALIDQYGFDPDIYNGTGGNNIALNLVVEGLKLQPCSPGFVDGRNAILQADLLLYGGANECLIWDAFAKRGLGYSATQGSSQSRSDGTEAFDTPSATAAFVAPPDVCEDKPIMNGLSGGTPAGGVYSGIGVTDDGNGMTYSFDPAVAGVGVHTITYTKAATSCAAASSASDEIEVTPGLAMECPNDIEVSTSASNCSAVVTYATPVGASTCAVSGVENFDGVSAPSLPTGWTTATDSGTANLWKTVTTQSSSSPNSAFAENKASVSLSSLTSIGYLIGSPNAVLKFKLRYDLESSYDGAVLEYSVDGGSWKDILNGGGAFVSGNYIGQISSSYQNPIGGRQAWTGNSGGFIDVKINLNSSLNTKTVKFRWRIGSDSMVSAPGIWVDNVEVEGLFSPAPTTTQTAGLPSGSEFPLGTTTNTFEVTDGAGNTNTCSFDVIVTDGIDPTIVCPADQTVEVPQGQTYTLPDYWANGEVTATDNCSTVQDKVQSPAPGTQLAVGTHAIEFSVKDSSGNLSSCFFTLTVDEEMGTIDVNSSNAFGIYPNPADHQIVISNPNQEKILKVMISDMSGRTMQEVKLNNQAKENSISIKHYSSGTYLVQIVGEKHTVVKKLVKK